MARSELEVVWFSVSGCHQETLPLFPDPWGLSPVRSVLSGRANRLVAGCGRRSSRGKLTYEGLADNPGFGENRSGNHTLGSRQLFQAL